MTAETTARRRGFAPGPVEHARYADGTEVPRIALAVTLGGARVGYAEVHLHRNGAGPSFGFTGVIDAGAPAAAWEGDEDRC